MPGPYEILNARVQQKIATEADWLAVEDDLGNLLPGEQAFVFNTDGVAVNFKIGDGTKKFSELPYFIAYYSNVLNQKILSYINKTIDLVIPSTFRNFSCVYDIVLINNSGTNIDLKVGTSAGANDLFEIILPNGVYSINLRKVFSAVTTLYLSGLAGKNYSMFIVYYQYDEAPAIPPTDGGDTPAFKWPRCFQGMFTPLNGTDLDATWDFTSGLGKAGTMYANCCIAGTNGTESMGRFYPVGWQAGDSLRPATNFGGSGLITLTEANIPKHAHKLFSGAGPIGELLPDALGTKAVAWAFNVGTNRDYQMKQAADSNVSAGTTSSYGEAIPTAIDVRPKSKVVLYFVAISD